MKEAILIIILIALFISGYFLMKKIDIFMDDNQRKIEKETNKTEPSYIVLTGDLTDEEVAAEIRRFRSKHGKSDIFIYNNQLINQDETDFKIKK